MALKLANCVRTPLAAEAEAGGPIIAGGIARRFIPRSP
jgi:hypothetical protein